MLWDRMASQKIRTPTRQRWLRTKHTHQGYITPGDTGDVNGWKSAGFPMANMDKWIYIYLFKKRSNFMQFIYNISIYMYILICLCQYKIVSVYIYIFINRMRRKMLKKIASSHHPSFGRRPARKLRKVESRDRRRSRRTSNSPTSQECNSPPWDTNG